MPQLDLFAWIIWIAYFAGEVVTVAFLWRRGIIRRWPSLAAFLTIKSLVDVSLLCLTPATFLGEWRCVAYFWVFWAGDTLADIAEMWMVIQIGSALVEASPKAVRAVWITTLAVAVLCVLGFSHLDLWPNYGQRYRFISFLVGTDRIVAISWLTTFLCVAVFSDLLGIRWRRHPFGIAIGFAIHSTTEIAVSWFLGTLTFANARFLSNLSGSSYLLSLAIWAITFARQEPMYEFTPSVRGALSSALALRSTLQRIVAK
jgi:hypothetical protein